MILEVENISKQFYGVTVLDIVSITFSPGEVHAIVGENGAGKSTLIKIIGGTYHADSGQLKIDGRPVNVQSVLDASSLGISIVYQEYNLVKDMTVLENVMLGKEKPRKFGKLNQDEEFEYVKRIADKDHIKVDLKKYAGDLSSAEAKIAEILRACLHEMSFLILDEPTAALDEDDAASLFSLINNLKQRGIGIIYISHRLDEVFELCDKATVLKDGKHVGTWDTADIDHDFLINSMVGREITEIFPGKVNQQPQSSQVVLSAESISDGEHFFDVSFQLRKGEILGIGGMSGHGQREVIRSLFGAVPLVSGSIKINGKSVELKTPADAVQAGLAFISDDRRNEGLALEQSVRRNMSYPSLKKYHASGVLNPKKETALVSEMIQKLNIKLASQHQSVKNLSGGNQQRVVFAKWLPLHPDILLCHEPTLGVDVGAKVEIYEILHALTQEGISIFMVTSDMLELLNMSDTICVFYEGRIISTYSSSEATEEIIMAAASGKPAEKGVVH